MNPVLVSVGSNLAPERNIPKALRSLNVNFGPLTCSPIYVSDAVGFDGPPFHNMAVRFVTEASPAALVLELRRIEDRLGRRRDGPRFGDRTIDLDLLLYADVVLTTDAFSLPRPELTEQSFVLGPAADIAGEWIHPLDGVSLASLWLQMGETLTPIDTLTALESFDLASLKDSDGQRDECRTNGSKTGY